MYDIWHFNVCVLCRLPWTPYMILPPYLSFLFQKTALKCLLGNPCAWIVQIDVVSNPLQSVLGQYFVLIFELLCCYVTFQVTHFIDMRHTILLLILEGSSQQKYNSISDIACRKLKGGGHLSVAVLLS